MTEVGKIENAPETTAAPVNAPVVPKTRTNAAGTSPQKKAVGGGIKRPAAVTPVAATAKATPTPTPADAPVAPVQETAPVPEPVAETPVPVAAATTLFKKKKTADAAKTKANPVPAVDATATKANEKFKQFGYKEGNILMKISPTKLIVEIDLTQRLGRSQSGKSEIIARTAGVAGMEIPGLPGKQLQVQCYDTGVKRKAAFDEIG